MGSFQSRFRNPPLGAHCSLSRQHSSERSLSIALSDEEIAKRVAEYEQPEPLYTRGVMAKYAATVSSASEGAIT